MYAASIGTTTDNLEWPFHASRAISAVAELLVNISRLSQFIHIASYLYILDFYLLVFLLFQPYSLSLVILPRDAAMLAQSWDRNSVRLSVTRVLCDKTKQCTADTLIPHERAITLVFWYQ